jgi:hypothetical protein
MTADHICAQNQIALVMGGAAENCAGAVIHQNEIRDPNGQFPAGSSGWRTRRPVSKPFFLGLFHSGFGCVPFCGILAECRNLGVFCLELLWPAGDRGKYPQN